MGVVDYEPGAWPTYLPAKFESLPLTLLLHPYYWKVTWLHSYPLTR